MTVYSSAIGQFTIGLSPIQGTPPNAGPFTLQTTIPAYPYWEYADDDDVQALFDIYNQLAQYYLDWFNQTPLPVYTSSAISGSLLDWVAEGLYGMNRPLLGSGFSRRIGAIDTDIIDQLEICGTKIISGGSFQLASDDVFKRVMTWNLYKGDGKLFNTTWLKRHVMRFLVGENGLDGLNGGGVQETYDVSVNLVGSGSGFGSFGFGVSGFGGAGSGIVIHINNAISYDPNVLSALQEAVSLGILQLPFQETFSVTY